MRNLKRLTFILAMISLPVFFFAACEKDDNGNKGERYSLPLSPQSLVKCVAPRNNVTLQRKNDSMPLPSRRPLLPARRRRYRGIKGVVERRKAARRRFYVSVFYIPRGALSYGNGSRGSVVKGDSPRRRRAMSAMMRGSTLAVR